MTTCFLIRA